ncbi:hypothetical protein HMPREF9578_01075 [Cutibacterium acnes HL110PA4]|nr:hypothetical protein HMPREF9619_01947 [Cutibacterium acnes HL082PA2]EFT26879.1 hypothetical protein HMPREF9577_00594 [Cutibacterium acnes HL110PA3]EFT63415.1 hypothetical protein HMPREF9578_01075 [Cutibacterium acnes HL110PA4]EFT77076.1 hypothetical protein HMPREF9599_01803 [Cutibacterium acnes HL050PA2]EGE70930.1 hypothetical protein HMPREF9341_00642 [Cutibacterium acnes HL103PA1]
MHRQTRRSVIYAIQIRLHSGYTTENSDGRAISLKYPKPISAIQSVKFVRIYSAETISFSCINHQDNTSGITGSDYVDIFDCTNRTILNDWSWAFSHKPVVPKWWHHIVPKTWLR